MAGKKSFAFILALVALPLGTGGSSADPEITDAGGDAGGRSYLDLRSLWVTNDETHIHFNIKVGNLATANPIELSEGTWRYDVRFTDDIRTNWIGLYIGGVNTQPVGGQGFCNGLNCIYVGTTARSSDSGSPSIGKVDVDSDVITLSFARNVNTNPTYRIDDGASLTNIRVSSGYSMSMTPTDSEWVNVDYAGPGFYQVV